MFDLAIDLESCDLMFGPHTDLLGASGDVVTRQRILARCKIPRGSWVYDETGTLGSRLYQISGHPTGQQLSQSPSLVQEALEPMQDIRVGQIVPKVTQDNHLAVFVGYQPIGGLAGDEVLTTEPAPEFDVTLTL